MEVKTERPSPTPARAPGPATPQGRQVAGSRRDLEVGRGAEVGARRPGPQVATRDQVAVSPESRQQPGPTRRTPDFKSWAGDEPLREWGPGDQRKLDQALSGERTFEGVDKFHQGSEKNCASIAVIKSAMDVFGNQVFQDVDKQPDGSYNVTMRDGYTTNVSQEELAKAAQAGDFQGADSDQESYATLMWAAMANRAADQGFEGAQTYDEALHALQNGAVTRDVPELLGLQDYMRDVNPQDVASTDAVVGIARRDGGGHAVYIDNGQVDLWGDSRPYDPSGFETSKYDYDYKDFFTFSREPQPQQSWWESLVSRIDPRKWFS